MKKYFYTLSIFLFFFTGYLNAQNKYFGRLNNPNDISSTQTYEPYFQFQCDSNSAEQYFLFQHLGQFAGDHRFADGTNEAEYHFDLGILAAENAIHPLVLRIHVQNEYVIETSPTPIDSLGGGGIVAQYAPGTLPFPANGPAVTDGSNATWIDIPIQQFIDIGWTDIYLALFDGKPNDGWGPSFDHIGFFYLEDASLIKDNSSPVAVIDGNIIKIDGNTSEWNPDSKLISLQSNAPGIVSVGNTSGLSATSAVQLDDSTLYFNATVNDNSVTDADSVVFYLGTYSIGDSDQIGHIPLQVNGKTLDGYRTRVEADYRFVVTNIASTPTLTETKVIGGSLPNGKIAVVKTATGYTVEAMVKFSDLFVQGVTNGAYTINLKDKLPFAFKIVGSNGGSLITGDSSDVDTNPSSWDLKTNFADDRTASSSSNGPALGITRAIIPGFNDQRYFVSQYPGSGFDNRHRWADGHDTLVFHFDVPALMASVPNQNLFIGVHVSNEYVIDTSSSLTGSRGQIAEWSTIGKAVHDGSNATWIEVPLTSSMNDLYLWFTDGIDTTGWGSSIDSITVYYKGVMADTNLITFIPGNDSANGDKNYLVVLPNTDTTARDSQHRWADGTHAFSYKFNLADLKAKTPANANLSFSVHMGNEWRISVAKDENSPVYYLDDWTHRNDTTADKQNESNQAWNTYSLKPYIDSSWSTVMFIFSDEKTVDGWGASVRADFTTQPGTELPGVRVYWSEIVAYYPFVQWKSADTSSVELKYLDPNFTGQSDHFHRFADASSELLYRFPKNDLLALDGGNPNIIYRVEMENEFEVYVTNGGLDTVHVLDYDPADPAGSKISMTTGKNHGVYEIPFKQFFDMGWDTLQVIYADGKPEDGWGPALYSQSLSTLQTATLTGIQNVKRTIPDKFTLNQNYPNPFNPSTIISYALPAQGRVLLKIYNVLGQEIRTLVDDVQAPGAYRITWNGDNNHGFKVATGIYFYRMLYNQQQIVKKMLLLK